MDEEGYPTEEELKRYETEKDIDKLILFVRSNWWPGDEHGTKYSDGILQLHTGGWSGNESTISALRCNAEFWSTLLGERAGGHYYFEIEYHKATKWMEEYFAKKKEEGVKDP